MKITTLKQETSFIESNDAQGRTELCVVVTGGENRADQFVITLDLCMENDWDGAITNQDSALSVIAALRQTADKIDALAQRLPVKAPEEEPEELSKYDAWREKLKEEIVGRVMTLRSETVDAEKHRSNEFTDGEAAGLKRALEIIEEGKD
jgi:hypothetical protein